MTMLPSLPAPQYAELPGTRLLYRDNKASGSVIVALHANTGTSETWHPQFSFFTQNHYRFIAFDRRGLGGSIAHPETGPQPGNTSQDLDALVDHLGLTRFFLMGVAGGGFHTLDYAAWRPDRVLGLIVAASNGRISEPNIQAAIARLKVDLGPDASHAFELGPTYRMEQPDGLRRWLEIEDRSRQTASGSLQPLRQANTFAKLASIQCPALVMAGCADMLAPPALMRLWADHIQHSQFEVFPTAGHALPWEEPERFNQLSLEFIQRHARHGEQIR
ncbi:alpha/beta fold hydrolase [Pelagibacterium luteolum]|uniref:Pimeloyl-ACP methyl ester carboxylesterase n=1 Tax=Pelagibacterium luteolum TaxID=440168 RepID=A0A1G8AAW8_9HYPH|nr:alpha/beta hydrolase [Pelagibacterium luteolum]SDH18082.1 Pimeloyl-ACP methyl ester carboxylesterase [Pelagibacterium luteolum]